MAEGLVTDSAAEEEKRLKNLILDDLQSKLLFCENLKSRRNFRLNVRQAIVELFTYRASPLCGFFCAA